MGILMNLTSRLQAEPALKDSEGKQPERASDAASTANISKTESVTKVVKLDQISGRTNVVKSSETTASRWPAYDQYVPEKPEDTASPGYYRPVKGEHGDTRIEFTKPTEQAVQADGMDKLVKGEQAASKDGNIEMQEPDREATGEQVESKKDSDEQSSSNMEQIAGGKNKVQELKTKKKQLERDIKAATDMLTASNLKRKLAQVEKALKAATK
ncbi:hypothetical protein D1159_16285 [Pseudoflavonifractor sp. 524-17]|uniref:hypothetical protein n=1 Tax=Pseudoflavonifractor sp. 524-17 TaxID=2304577 RepID=UPI00137A83A1|nr:hypothetical protein [Pseudoflavonifractor sp. 524-17]NCE66095.1 hypothetical protein [Pseudoflavonifractor sp. 524-17]